MSTPPSAPESTERVLSTMNTDGSRRVIRLDPVGGRYLRRRRAVGYSLIALFVALPLIRLAGKPLVLFDLPRRQFTIFGATFLPTDSVLLMLLLVSGALTVFLVTALFGRAWCGWACPQTVYLELLFRPIERLIEGNASRQRDLDRGVGSGWRRPLKYVVFAMVSVIVAHVFLSYFLGWERLVQWVRHSPFEHPASFLVMAVTSVAMFADFAWFREQTCIVACPYGRFQSALLDKQSLIVGYDERRGEPRGKLRGAEGEQHGDCIDCGACLRCCPTGIDIRQGLQMECVACAQCADACDGIMVRLGRPRGLIRYTSQDQLRGHARRFLRARVVIYPLLVAVAIGALVMTLGRKGSADVRVLRGGGTPFSVLPDGKVSNHLRVRVVNRSGAPHRYTIELVGSDTMTLVAPRNPLPVAAGASEAAPVFLLVPRELFKAGEAEVVLRVRDELTWRVERRVRILGPR